MDTGDRGSAQLQHVVGRVENYDHAPRATPEPANAARPPLNPAAIGVVFLTENFRRGTTGDAHGAPLRVGLLVMPKPSCMPPIKEALACDHSTIVPWSGLVCQGLARIRVALLEEGGQHMQRREICSEKNSLLGDACDI